MITYLDLYICYVFFILFTHIKRELKKNKCVQKVKREISR